MRLRPDDGGNFSRRLERALSAEPPPFPAGSAPRRAAISRAVPLGSRRAPGQREWLRAVLAEIGAQGWYACRARHWADACRVYACYMDWADRIARPGHARVAAMAGIRERTVKRVVAWLHEMGYMGTVSPGTTPLVRPGVLYGQLGQEGNEAAVNVLCGLARPAAVDLNPPSHEFPRTRSGRRRQRPVPRHLKDPA